MASTKPDLETATPVEFDTYVADLYAARDKTHTRRGTELDAIHHAAGDRRNYNTRQTTWGLSDAAAIEQARRIADTDPTYRARDARRALDAYDAHGKTLDALSVEINETDEAFRARGRWSRFFTVRDGHVHTWGCHTWRLSTVVGWNPELSGQDEAAAVEALGPNLCTHCYPSAPVEWTIGKPKPVYCPGSNKWNVPRRGNRGQCPDCGLWQTMSMSGLRKHKAPVAK